MNEVKPITPNAIKSDSDLDLNSSIDYLNTKLLTKDFHDQINKIENYHAIILSPYGEYIDKMDRVVEKFKANGWDCYWKSAYDVRGPHYCFYVHEKHYK